MSKKKKRSVVLGVSSLENEENEAPVIRNTRSVPVSLDPPELPEVEQDILDDTAHFVAGIIAGLCVTLLGQENARSNIHLMYYTPENMIEPHCYMHVIHNPRMRKSYIEINFDRLILNLLHSEGVYTEFKEKMCKQIMDGYTDYMGAHEQTYIVRPKNNCPSTYQVSNTLTIYTVGLWESLEGKKEFINDPREVKLDWVQYKVDKSEQDYYNKLERFAAKVHDINIRLQYAGSMSPEDAYNEYKEFYNREFEIPYEEEDPETGEITEEKYHPLKEFYELSYFIDLLNFHYDFEDEDDE